MLSSFLMPQQVLSAALESLIKQALAMNSNTDNKLASLNNKSLSVHLNELGFPLCFSVSSEQILVTGNVENSDCHVQTSLQTLWQLKQEQQLTTLIKEEKLDLQGDIKVAQNFAAVAENLNIDWQSEIAKHIGDIPTYQLNQLSNALLKKLNFAKTQITADASEWLIHEKHLAVTQHEVSDFQQAVTHVNQRIDTIEQRITTLSQQLIK
jgi:ubiquinone biosynthesis protein UbiJ